MSPNDPKDPKDSNYANRDKKNFQKFIIDGIEYKIFLSGEDTQEKYSLVEMLFPTEEEKEIPLHRHSKETVIISIIEGTFQFKYGEQNIEGKEEMVFKFEKNIPHSYKKIGKNRGRLVLLFIPGGFENFFKDIGDLSKNKYQLSGGGGEDERVLLHLLEKKYEGRYVFE
ncbi:MAG: cupin domain-containing protein [Candidatus Nitrosocosmicus sp.]